jgi:hypothetical protein
VCAAEKLKVCASEAGREESPWRILQAAATEVALATERA